MEIATLELTAYQAVAVAAIVLLLGRFLCSKIGFLNTYCTPAPVVGGLVFAIVNLIGYTTGIGYITFDNTFQTFFMTVFFCSVGFTACFRLLKTGGIQVIIFLVVAIVLVLFQDILGTALATVFGLDARLGLCMGSIPLVGGHGTSGSFGPLLESLGVADANAVALASATFGLVAGSVIGGPIARARIKQKNLHSTDSGIGATADNGEKVAKKTIDNTSFLNALCTWPLLSASVLWCTTSSPASTSPSPPTSALCCWPAFCVMLPTLCTSRCPWKRSTAWATCL